METLRTIAIDIRESVLKTTQKVSYEKDLWQGDRGIKVLTRGFTQLQVLI